jgi:hypothetical protein
LCDSPSSRAQRRDGPKSRFGPNRGSGIPVRAFGLAGVAPRHPHQIKHDVTLSEYEAPEPLAFFEMLYYFIGMSENAHDGHHHHHSHHASHAVAGRMTWSLMRLSAMARLIIVAMALVPVWVGILLVTGL